jgi:hypothetical protein
LCFVFLFLGVWTTCTEDRSGFVKKIPNLLCFVFFISWCLDYMY